MNLKEIANIFPTPEFLNFSFAGLSISDSAIHCIQFGKKKDSFYIKKYTERIIPPGVIVSGQINNKEILIDILKVLKKDLDLNYVKVSLPEEKAYLFTAKIPRVTQKEIRSAIESKIEENVPVSPNELVFDYKLIDRSQNDYLIVSVSTLPISLISLYTYVFEKAELSLLSLEIESQAIVRSVLSEGNKENLDTVLVVNFGPEKVGLYVAVDRVVHFTSTISIKGESSKALDFLSQEIKKLYIYWHTLKQNIGKPNKKIKQIIICGEGFKDEVVSYLSTNNQTPTILGNVWANTFDVNTNVPEISFTDSLRYATSIGLALPSDILIQE
ncbi:MAG: pilus assembly protein PilM [Candidatus Zambryskibacteria bacterium]|nr:pilus assembly protein PilM [Candidatus Zambryskibacteria bacterium]